MGGNLQTEKASGVVISRCWSDLLELVLAADQHSSTSINKSPSTEHSPLSWIHFFQSITHHGHSLLVADVAAVTQTPP
jgi:hypothetical protein